MARVALVTLAFEQILKIPDWTGVALVTLAFRKTLIISEWTGVARVTLIFWTGLKKSQGWHWWHLLLERLENFWVRKGGAGGTRIFKRIEKSQRIEVAVVTLALSTGFENLWEKDADKYKITKCTCLDAESGWTWHSCQKYFQINAWLIWRTANENVQQQMI